LFSPFYLNGRSRGDVPEALVALKRSSYTVQYEALLGIIQEPCQVPSRAVPLTSENEKGIDVLSRIAVPVTEVMGLFRTSLTFTVTSCVAPHHGLIGLTIS
jgi:hypothetical protein